MLTKREVDILNYLYRHKSRAVTASEIAKECLVSNTTVKNEMNIISSQLRENAASIEPYMSRGYILNVYNDGLFLEYLANATSDFSDQIRRVNFIISYVLSKNRPVNTEKLANLLYISKTQFYKDLSMVKAHLKPYDLNVETVYAQGITIQGSEINKRLCIIKEGLYAHNLNTGIVNFDATSIQVISETVMGVFIEYNYEASDVILQNIVVHILISINRVLSNNTIIFKNTEDIDSYERDISRCIYEKLSMKFNTDIPEDEIYYLAVNLKGKRNYHDDYMVSNEINDFVFASLQEIDRQFTCSISQSADLRVALALHLTPLLLRLQYNMQITNEMKNEIRQGFPLAYEMSAIFANMITQRYGYTLSEDEIAFITLHFNNHYEKEYIHENSKNILLINTSRVSSSLLMYQKIYKQFQDYIEKLTITYLGAIRSIDVNSYDIVLTTSLRYDEIPENAVKISDRIDSNDLSIIEQLLRVNEKSSVSLASCMDKDLICLGSISDKTEMLEHLCMLAGNKYHLIDNKLLESTLEREKLGFTSYGNRIALPHTMEPVTEETFICIGVSNKPIPWTENEEVYVVFLISIGKDNQAHGLHGLFNSMSKIITNRQLTQKLINSRSANEIYTLLTEEYSIN